MRDLAVSTVHPQDFRRPRTGPPIPLSVRAAGAIAALFLCVVSGPEAVAAATASSPNFDAATFRPLDCPGPGEARNDEGPPSVDLVGDASHPASFVAWDASYVYFRFRVDSDPTGPKGFNQYAWVILMQVPSGNAFQHQFEISLNGMSSDDDFGNTSGQKGDTIEVWKNDPAENVEFSPLFRDPSETRLFAQRFDYAGPGTANTSPIARIALASDGSSVGGDADYFVEFAVPMSVLIAKRVVTGISEVAESLFYPATSSDANQYNKDHLECPFLPMTELSITKGVAPSEVPATVATGVVHTITVRNSGDATAKGIVVRDTAFPTSLAHPTVHVTSDDPNASWTIVTTNPLLLQVPRLLAGKSVTVRIDSDATFACSTAPFTNTASVFATNSEEVSATATLKVSVSVPELCNHKDDNCDGQIDEGDASCGDGNACNGQESCVSGNCRAGTPLNCDDGNPCVDDRCDPASGCLHTNATAGTSCDDGNLCTPGDTCQSGVCTAGSPVVCLPAGACRNAGTCNPATGLCSSPSKPDGSACSDGEMCTVGDTCSSGQCVGGPVFAPDCKDPKSDGYYSWLCEGTRQQDALTLADVDCVNDWSIFASVSSVDDICRILNPNPSDDVCLQADAQLLAAILNFCKGRLTLSESITSACSYQFSIWQSLTDTITRLANPARTVADCEMARCQAEELNSLATGAAYILVHRIGSIVRVSWTPPVTPAGWAAPSSFTIWRRTRGVGSFTALGTVTDLKFDDSQAIPGTDFEYQVGVNR